jgi:hypothetical protein
VRRLPLPVGLNVVRRDPGPTRTQEVCSAIRQSLRSVFSLMGVDSAGQPRANDRSVLRID